MPSWPIMLLGLSVMATALFVRRRRWRTLRRGGISQVQADNLTAHFRKPIPGDLLRCAHASPAGKAAWNDWRAPQVAGYQVAIQRAKDSYLGPEVIAILEAALAALEAL